MSRGQLKTNRPTPAQLAEVARRLAAHDDVLHRIVDPGEPFATRIASGEGWEAWLHGWPPGHRSGFHDHAASSAAFLVLDGELEETLVLSPRSAAGPARLATRTLGPRRLRAFGGDTVHELANLTAAPATSIHVVGPVPAAPSSFALDDDGALQDAGPLSAPPSWFASA